ncbi:Hsp20/alpha crystallin family protein [Oleiagrimonas sp. C23AA]|uniref:Hsp20/alpha crystallin family protein n=1 Tax=Oleiagrimonas sp. C23AA TaxID=2719047 RepID=UPI001421B5E2|nr:Hsp20/alpha crystallin family protein [Oleiagrimonas sp. C23AA]NII09569.1 Hsp20/alpha crystallin family protein [Oleiagrimonas sp. C23AA]
MTDKPKPHSKSARNPFRGFMDVMSEMNRVQSNWMRASSEGAQAPRSHDSAYVPPADIFAKGDDLIVRCELPGIRRDQVSVTVSNGVLTISGYRDSQLDNNVVYYTRERVYGAFRRSMLLPEGVDQDHISASVRNGLLEITVANGAKAKPRNIDIAEDEDE